MSEKLFTYQEVKSILCDCCNLKIPDIRDSDKLEWYHFVHGQRITCTASEFRNNANIQEEF